MTGKRRTREHMIADQSAHHLERHVLACGFMLERIVRDYGVDFQLFTDDDDGQVEPGQALLQLKATSSVRFQEHRQVAALRVERADLRRWLKELMPVILIVYDAREDVAYRVCIQAHFRRLPGLSLDRIGETVTVHIPISNRLDTATIRRFARFRDAIFAQAEGIVHHDG